MVRLVFAVALTLALATSPALAQPAHSTDAVPAAASSAAGKFDPNVIQPDPAIRRGTLPNGLRYAVMRNAKPKNGVSLRLGMDIGSFDETDDERGVAHFVEHMVFNGSKNFPEGEVEKVFLPLGVGFGRDQNAGTGLFSTVYGIDLHDTAAKPLDTAFRWLRDVADGALFNPESVNRERGVILAEREADLSAIEATQEAMQRYLGKGLRSTDRDPIGTLASLKAIDSAKLRAFYKRWYRPDNAVVVVVADLPVDVLEQRVRDSFSSWTAEAAATPRAKRGAPDGSRGVETLIRPEANVPTVVKACRIRPVDPDTNDVAAVRRRSASALWRWILENRLARVATSATPSFLSADLSFTDYNREAAETCLSLMPINDEWEPGLKAALAEMRRMAAQGPTDREFEHGLEEIRSQYRGAVGQVATRDSVTLAQAIAQETLEGGVIASPREAFRVYDAAVEDLTPEDVRLAMSKDWSGDGPLLTVIGPTPPRPEALQVAWRDSDKAELLARYDDIKPAKWAYTSFGKPGAVKKREVVTEGDFVRLTFKNGVVLNFKHTDFDSEEVLVDVRFGRGQRDIPDAENFTATMAAASFKAGGVGRLSVEELYAIFGTTSWDADLVVADDAFLLRGRANASSLEPQLNLLAAYMSDPGFRPALDARLPSTMQATYRLYRTSPQMALSVALNKAFNGTVLLPSEEEASRIRSKDFERLLRPVITTSPMEISIVGDTSEEEAVKLVARTFGALPKRDAERQGPANHAFMRFPNNPPALITATHEGSAEKAVTSVIWPLYTALPARRREEMALSLVAEIFSNALRQRVREELGQSYAPEAATYMPDNADQGMLTAVIEAYPADVDNVVEETIKVAERLAKGAITQDDLDAARQPMLSGMTAEARQNDWWIDVLSGSAANAERAPDILGMQQLTASITLAEVRKAAADWLSKKPIVVVARPKPLPATTVAQAEKAVD